jgi:hypothetical protein
MRKFAKIISMGVLKPRIWTADLRGVLPNKANCINIIKIVYVMRKSIYKSFSPLNLQQVLFYLFFATIAIWQWLLPIQ